jgi:DNA-binding CsgD family transcriptional regulator
LATSKWQGLCSTGSNGAVRSWTGHGHGATGRRCRALLRAAQGDLAGALDALDQAFDIHRRLPYPVELARTLVVRGQLQRRANQRRNAQVSFEQARTIFEEIGSVQWSRRASAELTRLGLHHAAGRDLTPRERQVAEGAGGGATNNQIAAALNISPKTVEANLSRAYTKLGISSRAELGAWLAAQRRGQEPSA